jgi:hypothetical protein
MNMRGQEMADVGGLKSEFPDTVNHRVKDGLRAAVHQEQFIRPAFDERDANDVGCTEVECVDQVNHSDQ